jgi:hypothetical protein
MDENEIRLRAQRALSLYPAAMAAVDEALAKLDPWYVKLWRWMCRTRHTLPGSKQHSKS